MASPIMIGSTGIDVKKMQYYLNQLSRTPNSPALVEDGIFGQRTQFAVVIFQYLYDLPIDGVIGPATWDAIITAFKRLDNPTPERQRTGYALRSGNTGLAVQKFQGYLNQLNDPSPNLNVDGTYGSRTQEAVRVFQAQHRLNIDGVIGNTTWDKMIDLI